MVVATVLREDMDGKALADMEGMEDMGPMEKEVKEKELRGDSRRPAIPLIPLDPGFADRLSLTPWRRLGARRNDSWLMRLMPI